MRVSFLTTAEKQKKSALACTICSVKIPIYSVVDSFLAKRGRNIGGKNTENLIKFSEKHAS